MNPTLQQRMAELRVQQLHAEAAHARLVKEARAAKRARRGPSRITGLITALRSFAPATAVERPAVRPVPRPRTNSVVEC